MMSKQSFANFLMVSKNCEKNSGDFSSIVVVVKKKKLSQFGNHPAFAQTL